MYDDIHDLQRGGGGEEGVLQATCPDYAMSTH